MLLKFHIHIERVIGLIKNKYTLLQRILPISLCKFKGDSEYSVTDKMLTICATLINNCSSVVPP